MEGEGGPVPRALLVANPKARRGPAGVVEAEAALGDAGLSVTVDPITSSKKIAAAIERAAGRVDLIVIGGGDGTISAALPALLEARRPLGILPLGTANNTARTLGIPSDLSEAAAVIARGTTRRIDVGCVNGAFFLTTASLGLSVRITDELSDASKRRWGPFAYALAAARTLARARPFVAEITHEGGTRRLRAIQIVVGNGRHYGAGLTVAEGAALDDARLDCYAIEAVPWWRLLALLPALRSGRQGSKEPVEAIRARRIEITTPVPHRIDADGEIVGTTPATFTVLPEALEVFVPGNP